MTGEKRSDLPILLVMALLAAALFFAGSLVALPDVRSPGQAGAFDATRAVERLARVLGDERPHPVDSAANDAVRERLIAEIEALGYAPETRDDFSCLDRWGRVHCARVRNVLFRAGPAGEGAVMLVAHYDSVPAGPGAGDAGIGVASMLEIAGILADAPLARPVIFLFTDGEEAGLLGASSFVRNDPWAKDVSAVINLEARGVRGPAFMFETSQPNARAMAAFAKGVRRPYSNSLATDIYRLLPNDTDASMFLPEGWALLNMALTEGVEFYHTPHDNLASLDPKSVQHMGDQALGVARAFQEEADVREGQVIFADILSRLFIVLPAFMGPAVIGAALVLSVIAFVRAGGGRPLRAAFVAPATLVFAGAIAWGLQALIGGLRPEAAYWSAYPAAIRALAYFSAFLGGLAMLAFLGAGAGRARLVHAAWFWFAALGGGASVIAPGGSVLFALPLVFYAVGAAAGVFLRGVERPFSIFAALLAVAIFAPEIHGAEITLGLGFVAISAVTAGVLVMLAAPLAAAPQNRTGAAPVAVAAVGLAFAAGAALIVPAYSEAKPRPLSLQYFVDAEAREAKWLIAGADEPAPPAMQARASFERLDIEGLGAGRLAATAPFLETPPPEAMILADETADGERRVRFMLVSNGADRLSVLVPAAARARSVVENGRTHDFPGDGDTVLACAGRGCDGATFTIVLGDAAPTDWLIIGHRYGLPADAAPLIEARPDWAVPIQTGDVTVIRARKKV